VITVTYVLVVKRGQIRMRDHVLSAHCGREHRLGVCRRRWLCALRVRLRTRASEKTQSSCDEMF
jgi:hypothetical protein